MSCPQERTVSVRLSKSQYRCLNNVAKFFEHSTGNKVSSSTVMLKLMEKGWDGLQEEISELRVEANSGIKRFTKVHLA